jgi:hypothetical protein
MGNPNTSSQFPRCLPNLRSCGSYQAIHIEGGYRNAARISTTAHQQNRASVSRFCRVGASRDGEPGGAVPGADAYQEVRFRLRDLPGKEAGGEVPVGQQEHSDVQAGQQQRRAGGLSAADRTEHSVDHGSGAAADQGQQPKLRVAGAAMGAAALF